MTDRSATSRPVMLERWLGLLAGLLVIRVTLVVVSRYHNYFPLDLASEFLHGREGHFWGWYRWAFYTHILTGPLTLLLGLFLVSPVSRNRFPRSHRVTGRIQVAIVLLLVAPSGLAMAYHAAAGRVAGLGLATLAVLTAFCAAQGTLEARQRRFTTHRRWMWRCYLLLCSAVVLRLLGGLATVVGLTWAWVDPLATWLCWVVPLAAFECREEWVSRGQRRKPSLNPFGVQMTD